MTPKKLLIQTLQRFPAGDVLTLLLDLRKRYLTDQGWIKSIETKTPVDASGGPIPWFSYASIYFLAQRLNDELTVFEYGSGNSTRWFSERVGKIVSVEHEEGWYQYIKASLSSKGNVDYRFRSLTDGSYVKAILEEETKFDVVIVDGRQRVACAKTAVNALTKKGVIIWDNAEREDYREGYDFLTDLGFKRLDFNGLAPINRFASTTAIFYRSDNCLGI